MLGLFTGLSAQTQIEVVYKKAEKEPDIEKLKEQKEKVELKEKQLLKADVERINKALENEEITEEEAEEQKKIAATKRAKNINDQIKIIDANIDLISRNLEEEDDLLYYQHMAYLGVDADSTSNEDNFKKTFSGIVIGFGFSNARAENSSLGDRYRVGGSRYFDVGYQWSTGLTADNFLRVNYGVMFQFNGLKPKDRNQYFIADNGEVDLQHFEEGSLKKAKLRMSNMVVPLHLELGKTNKSGYGHKFKMGVGGFAGVNLSTIEKLKYKDADGKRRKRKDRFNSQAEDWVYGWSGYIGYRNTAFYMRYHMDPIFKHNANRENILAFGIQHTF